MAISADGRALARGNGDGTTDVYELQSGRKLASVAAMARSAGSLLPARYGMGTPVLSDDGTLLAIHGENSVRVVEVEGGRVVAELEATAIAFSADGRSVVVGTGHGGAPLPPVKQVAGKCAHWCRCRSRSH